MANDNVISFDRLVCIPVEPAPEGSLHWLRKQDTDYIEAMVWKKGFWKRIEYNEWFTPKQIQDENFIYYSPSSHLDAKNLQIARSEIDTISSELSEAKKTLQTMAQTLNEAKMALLKLQAELRDD